MTLRETMAALINDGYELKSKGIVRFHIKNYDAKIDDTLQLPTRMNNAILRNKLITIGDLIDYIGNGVIRGIGAKTIRETKQAIIEWYWSTLDDTGKAKYIQELFV